MLYYVSDYHTTSCNSGVNYKLGERVTATPVNYTRENAKSSLFNVKDCNTCEKNGQAN